MAMRLRYGWRCHAPRAAVRSVSDAHRALSTTTGARTDTTALVPAAVKLFHERYGHAIIAPRYVIPTAPKKNGTVVWPTEMHGLKLGSILQRIFRRTHEHQDLALKEQLVAVGYPEDSRQWQAYQWRETVLAALQMYQRMHGDLYVPRSFVVPSGNDSWPRATWGLRLGLRVYSLRQLAKKQECGHGDDDHGDAQLPQYQHHELERLDFAWDVMEHKWTTRFLPALRRFHELYGHCDVPQAFVVPVASTAETNLLEDDEIVRQWRDAPQCRGYRLGAAVNKIRRGDTFLAQLQRPDTVDELDALGFTFNSFDRNWTEKVLPALETFHGQHGHSDVPAYFMIPDAVKDGHSAEETEANARQASAQQSRNQWPAGTSGMRLGFIVQNIRSRGDYFPQIMRDSARLDAIGFVWNRSAVKWKHTVLPALETFVKIHGHSQVPSYFVVPQEAPWPEPTHALRLGRIATVSSARQKFANYIEIDHKRLHELGFQWSLFEDDKLVVTGIEDERYSSLDLDHDHV